MTYSILNKIKEYLKEELSISSYLKVKHRIQDIMTIPFGRNLKRIGEIYGTDKTGSHYYLKHYSTHFKRFKYKKINLLEIGVGGYENPYSGGNSLRMWRRYFPFADIFSLDIHDKSALEERRIKIFKGSQVDDKFLENITNEIGGDRYYH